MKELLDLSPEVRSDYQVTTARKKLWNIELNIYLEFSRICEDHGLKHFLIYGAHLGAVRHHGFIPWDDDLDVGMLRDDFEKFVAVADKELPEEYSIVYGIVGKQQFPLLRIRYKNSTAILRKDLEGSHNSGVFLEVYVLDDVPDDKESQQNQINRVENLQYLTNVKLQYRYSLNKEGISTFFRLLPMSARKLWEKTQTECTRYRGGKNNKYVNCVQMPCYARRGSLFLEKSVTQNVIDVPFETVTVKIMRDPICLIQSYSNYMELPSLEERGEHHNRIVFYDPDTPYAVYRKSQKIKDYFEGKGDEPFH